MVDGLFSAEELDAALSFTEQDLEALEADPSSRRRLGIKGHSSQFDPVGDGGMRVEKVEVLLHASCSGKVTTDQGLRDFPAFSDLFRLSKDPRLTQAATQLLGGTVELFKDKLIFKSPGGLS